jgi:hypothetical protein
MIFELGQRFVSLYHTRFVEQISSCDWKRWRHEWEAEAPRPFALAQQCILLLGEAGRCAD